MYACSHSDPLKAYFEPTQINRWAQSICCCQTVQCSFFYPETLSYASVAYGVSGISCTWERKGRAALVEHVTASAVMHASRVRTPPILRGVFREISLFLPFQRD